MLDPDTGSRVTTNTFQYPVALHFFLSTCASLGRPSICLPIFSCFDPRLLWSSLGQPCLEYSAYLIQYCFSPCVPSGTPSIVPRTVGNPCFRAPTGTAWATFRFLDARRTFSCFGVVVQSQVPGIQFTEQFFYIWPVSSFSGSSNISSS